MIVAMVSLLAITPLEAARACSCFGPPETPEQLAAAMRYSACTFIGSVIASADTIVGLDVDGAGVSDGRMRVSTFQVEWVWHGDSTARYVSVLSHSSTLACGYPFGLGGRYIVFARSAPAGRLRTDLCSGNRAMGRPSMSPGSLRVYAVLDSVRAFDRNPEHH